MQILGEQNSKKILGRGHSHFLVLGVGTEKGKTRGDISLS